ncbi:MAG TPA: TonB-dependent receptor [Steroidobacteraceae bacterium]|jgi:outer membrane receptor protein involved in Fe transport|nr:TonB-dependent receptor [Steroidobacteraceae bacterium]
MHSCGPVHKAVAAALAASSLIAASGLGHAADIVASTKQVQVDIKAQSLASALSAFALQTHEQIIVTQELTRNKTTAGVRGTYVPLAALQHLLHGTGLTYSTSPDGTILVAAVRHARPAADPPQQPSGDPPLTTEQNAKYVLHEVVVTATGRAESVQNIPYNISAVSGATLQAAGVSDFHQLAQLVGGVDYADVGPRGALSSSFVIRGISVGAGSSPQFPSATAAPISTYIDSTPIFANLWFLDLDRVEVLRGPQGTLYGADSEGGTIRFIYNPPSFDRFTADVSADGSRTDGATGLNGQGVLTLNAPIAHDLAFRATVGEQRDSGFINAPDRYALGSKGDPLPVDPSDLIDSPAVRSLARGVNWDTTTAAQAALRWRPSSLFDATLSYHHQVQNSGGPQLVSYQAFGVDSDETMAQIPEPFHSTVDVAALEVTSNLGFATFTNSTSSYETRATATNDFTGFYFSFPFYTAVYGNNPRPLFTGQDAYNSHGVVQEFRLVSATPGPFKWVAGAFYERVRTTTINQQYALGYSDFYTACSASTTTTVPCGYGTFYPQISSFDNGEVPNSEDFCYLNDADVLFRDMAVYGDFEWRLSDHWRLTGGLRGYHDSSSNDENGGLLFLGPTGVGGSTITTSDSGVLGKAGVSYNFTPSTMVYALFSQGNRPAGTNGLPQEVYNFGGAPTPTQSALFVYRSDTVDNREVGIKGVLANRIQYTFTYFNDNWNDVQLGTTVTALEIGAVINAGDARSDGIELELNGPITRQLNLSVSYTYDNSRLVSTNPPAGVPASSYSVGQNLPGDPKEFGDVTLQYTQPLPRDLVLTYALGVNYVGRSASALLTSQNVEVGGFATVEPSVSLIGDSWTVRAYVDNAANRVGVYGYSATNWGLWSGASVTRPRTIGLSGSYFFR